MFPAGTAGAALLLLRVAATSTLLVDGTGHGSLITSSPMLLLVLLLATFLCIGLFTPYCATVCILLQIGVLVVYGRTSDFHLAMSIVNGGMLALLGPGAFSIDARLFGRRRLTVPARR